jgi:hypothetical protein
MVIELHRRDDARVAAISPDPKMIRRGQFSNTVALFALDFQRSFK